MRDADDITRATRTHRPYRHRKRPRLRRHNETRLVGLAPSLRRDRAEDTLSNLHFSRSNHVHGRAHVRDDAEGAFGPPPPDSAGGRRFGTARTRRGDAPSRGGGARVRRATRRASTRRMDERVRGRVRGHRRGRRLLRASPRAAPRRAFRRRTRRVRRPPPRRRRFPRRTRPRTRRATPRRRRRRRRMDRGASANNPPPFPPRLDPPVPLASPRPDTRNPRAPRKTMPMPPSPALILILILIRPRPFPPLP